MPQTSRTSASMIDIRHVAPADYADSGIGEYAFGATPEPRPAQNADRGEQYLQASRLLMSYEGTDPAARPMAKLGIQPMTLNVRGHVVPMGGIGGVSTMPLGRRRGHVRALMTAAFAQMRDDNQPVSALYPFRESFYERLGYVVWPRARYATLTPTDLQPLLRIDKPGSVDHMLIADGYDDWLEFLRAYQAETHGFSLRHPTNLASVRDDNRAWLVLVREGDEITGAMTYRITGWLGSLLARTFYARTATAHYQLLDWIARHADQVKEARVRIPADTLPELWFRDLEAPTATNDDENWAAPMGRIISIDALTGLRAGDGEATLSITDEYCPWNTGIWTLRGQDGTLTVTPGGTPTATLTIQGLSALLFTGTDPDIFPYRQWGSVDPSTSASLRTIFPPAVPYLHEEF